MKYWVTLLLHPVPTTLVLYLLLTTVLLTTLHLTSDPLLGITADAVLVVLYWVLYQYLLYHLLHRYRSPNLNCDISPLVRVEVLCVELRGITATALLLPRPLIVLSREVVQVLSREEVLGIVLHEYTHLRYLDSLTILLIVLSDYLSRTLLITYYPIPLHLVVLSTVLSVIAVLTLLRFMEVRADLSVTRYLSWRTYVEALQKILGDDTRPRLLKFLTPHPDLSTRIRYLREPHLRSSLLRAFLSTYY